MTHTSSHIYWILYLVLGILLPLTRATLAIVGWYKSTVTIEIHFHPCRVLHVAVPPTYMYITHYLQMPRRHVNVTVYTQIHEQTTILASCYVRRECGRKGRSGLADQRRRLFDHL